MVIIYEPKTAISYPVKYAVINTSLRLQARPTGETALWMPAISLGNCKSFNPIFTSELEQLYEIKITTASGCITIDTQLVKTVKEVAFMAPTAFTPNNDGKKDLLRPVIFGFKQLRYFKVFNRWGNWSFKHLPMSEVIGGDDKLYKANEMNILIQ